MKHPEEDEDEDENNNQNNNDAADENADYEAKEEFSITHVTYTHTA